MKWNELALCPEPITLPVVLLVMRCAKGTSLFSDFTSACALSIAHNGRGNTQCQMNGAKRNDLALNELNKAF